eukprot:665608-Pelagomonas_calceolata.AAC.1
MQGSGTCGGHESCGQGLLHVHAHMLQAAQAVLPVASALGILFSLIDVGSAYAACVGFLAHWAPTKLAARVLCKPFGCISYVL